MINKIYHISSVIAVLIVLFFGFLFIKYYVVKIPNRDIEELVEVKEYNKKISNAECYVTNLNDESYVPKLTFIKVNDTSSMTIYRETVSGLMITAGEQYTYSNTDGVFNIKFNNPENSFYSDISLLKLSDQCNIVIGRLDAFKSIDYLHSMIVSEENKINDEYKLANLIAEDIQSNYNTRVEEYRIVNSKQFITNSSNVSFIVDTFNFKTKEKTYSGSHIISTKNGYVSFSTMMYPIGLLDSNSNDENFNVEFYKDVLESISYK
jgi:hypothetical protein